MVKYLITGGAGSLGSYFLKELENSGQDMTDVRILDIDEHALSMIKYPVKKLYGSITDYDRLLKAMHKIDIVIHMAALKNLNITEYNTSELIKSNIIGTDNIANASITSNVKKVLFISSDKAVEPTSIYGASKLIGEHVILNNNNIQKRTRLSILRSGNFFKSNGNVFELWDKQLLNNEPITVTSMSCNRYFISTENVARCICAILDIMEGGEIFVPSEYIIRKYNMKELLKLHNITDLSNINLIGLRKGEKESEKLITEIEYIISKFNEYTSCYIIK